MTYDSKQTEAAAKPIGMNTSISDVAEKMKRSAKEATMGDLVKGAALAVGAYALTKLIGNAGSIVQKVTDVLQDPFNDAGMYRDNPHMMQHRSDDDKRLYREINERRDNANRM